MSYADEGTRPMTHLEERQRVEIDRLRAERAVYQQPGDLRRVIERMHEAEARVAAVIALCDRMAAQDARGDGVVLIRNVRAAATGDTNGEPFDPACETEADWCFTHNRKHVRCYAATGDTC